MRRPGSLAPGELAVAMAVAPGTLLSHAFAAQGIPALRHRYLGVPGLACLRLSPVARYGGLRVAALLAIALASLALAIGGHTPLFALFQELPTGV